MAPSRVLFREKHDRNIEVSPATDDSVTAWVTTFEGVEWFKLLCPPNAGMLYSSRPDKEETMVLRYIQPLRNILRIFSYENSPRQLALAIALGTMIGLLPKGNLIAVGLTILLFAVRVNLGAGLSVIFIISCLSTYLDPLTHGLGVRLLSHPLLHRFLAQSYELPIVPWTALNNSVVIGALLLGIALFYPIYHLSESLFRFLASRRATTRKTTADAVGGRGA